VSDVEKTPATRPERALTFMVVTLVGLSVLAIIAVLVCGLVGVNLNNDFGRTVALLPVIALPVGLVLMIALLVMSMRRRLRDDRRSK